MESADMESVLKVTLAFERHRVTFLSFHKGDTYVISLLSKSWYILQINLRDAYKEVVRKNFVKLGLADVEVYVVN